MADLINYPSDLIARMDRVSTIAQVITTPVGYDEMRENSNIFLDGSYFVVVYTCTEGTPTNYSLHWSRAHISDLETWAYMGVLNFGGTELEDPYIRIIGGVYHLTAEDKTYEKTHTPAEYNKVISLYTSSDFSTWVDQGIILIASAPDAWDDVAVYSPGDVSEAGVRYLFYNGLEYWTAPHPTGIGYAIYDDPTFDKFAGNPILITTDCPGFDVIGFDDVLKCNGSYVMIIGGLRGYYDPEVDEEWVSGILTSDNLLSGWSMVANYILNVSDQKVYVNPFFYDGQWYVLWNREVDNTFYLGLPIDSDATTEDFIAFRPA